MSNEWRDRIIRVGAITVMAVAAPGCVTGLIGLATGIPRSPPCRSGIARRGLLNRRCLPRGHQRPQPKTTAVSPGASQHPSEPPAPC